MDTDLQRVAEQLNRAQRILIITGAGLSADSGLPTYRGMGGLYNGHTPEGLPIEAAISGPMLQRDPALCWKYLAQLGSACLGGKPNQAHLAIARLQQLKPECWVLTQNIDGYHGAAGSPPERLIEIHGQLQPLYCQACHAQDDDLAGRLTQPLPPLCSSCSGVMRPPVVLFEERLPEQATATLRRELAKGFDLVMSVGTSASFPYIAEPVRRARAAGGFTVEINPQPAFLIGQVDVTMKSRALDVLPQLVSHTFVDRICKSN